MHVVRGGGAVELATGVQVEDVELVREHHHQSRRGGQHVQHGCAELEGEAFLVGGDVDDAHDARGGGGVAAVAHGDEEVGAVNLNHFT